MRIYTDVSVTDLAKPVLVDRAPQVNYGTWQVRLTHRLDAYLSAADARTISTAFATLADDIDAREAATAVTVDTDPTPAHGISRDLGADGRQDGAACAEWEQTGVESVRNVRLLTAQQTEWAEVQP